MNELKGLNSNEPLITQPKQLDYLDIILRYDEEKYYNFLIKQEDKITDLKIEVNNENSLSKPKDELTKRIIDENYLYKMFHDHLLEKHNDEYNNLIDEDIKECYEELLETIANPNDNEENKVLSLEELKKEHRKFYDHIITTDFTKIIDEYNKRKNVGRHHVTISDFLQDIHGIKRQYKIHETFQEDPEVKGYNPIHIDKIRHMMEEYKIKISDKDIENVISFISPNLKPVYNKVKFNNHIYDILEHEVYTPEESIFTLTTIDLDYKQHPYPTIKEYLKTSLKQGTEEERKKEREEKTEAYIQGILEIIGYFFTSGNIENKIIIITGLRGGGKSTFIKLIKDIFGNENISNTPFSRLNYNQFGTSDLINKILNISNDTDKKPIKDIGLYKQISGYDDIPIEKKGKDIISHPREEVPKLILVGNGVPEFKVIDDAFLERLIIIEFPYTFRGTEHENKSYNEGFPKEEIQGFVHDSLQRYKEHVQNQKSFILDKGLDETLISLEMHSKPYNYLVRELLAFDPKIERDEGLTTTEVMDTIVRLAKYKGIELSEKKEQRIKTRILHAIREEFELEDGYRDQTNGEHIDTYKPIPIRDETDKRVKIYPFIKHYGKYWKVLDEQKA
ncbi:MAG: DUF5906 domain-containing protein [Methanobrevibacter sp.]|jgi:hypothetical protein|nr:DUF5906 domain-containing protein [Candidatus Methanovirga procula]